MCRNICETLHREMEMLDEKYANGNQMNSQDLEHIDKIAHALKSIATYEAMQGSSEYGDSYARGRSRTTGRYMSRDGGSYAYDPYRTVPEGYERSERRY